MKCEFTLMSEHAKEAIRTLPTLYGIEYLIEVAIVETIVVLIPAIVMGAMAGMAAIIISVLMAFVLSYYSARTECRESLPMLYTPISKGGN